MENQKLYPAFLFINNVNAGKDIGEATNYWETRMADHGLLFASTNSGCVRLLLPDCMVEQIPDIIRGAKTVVISVLRGFTENTSGWIASITIEDGTDTPWNWLATLGSFDRMPSEADKRLPWTFALWARNSGKPHKFLECPAQVRYVNSLPCIRPYDPSID